MEKMISYDFTLDNIISVKAPRGTNPDTLREQLYEKLKDMVRDDLVFMFDGTFEEGE